MEASLPRRSYKLQANSYKLNNDKGILGKNKKANHDIGAYGRCH